jgi:hypothetical protein
MARPQTVSKKDLNVFVGLYVRTALWSTMIVGTGEFFDSQYDETDISDESLKEIEADCKNFITRYGSYFDDAFLISCPADCPFNQAARDLWLTRNGHLPGFNDGDWKEPAAAILTKASTQMGSCEIAIGDDNRLYFLNNGSPALNIWDMTQEMIDQLGSRPKRKKRKKQTAS